MGSGGGHSTVPLGMLFPDKKETPTAPRNTMIMTSAAKPEPKKRMTKAEMMKAEKAAMKDSIEAFAESKPTKKGVRDYFMERTNALNSY